VSASTAWTALIEALVDRGVLKTPGIKEAMLAVDRAQFFDIEPSSLYEDTPLGIDCQQTMSAPHMVAIMLEHLQLQSGQSLLEIGTGSGFNAAVSSILLGKQGHVYTLERFSLLYEKAKQRLAAYPNIHCYHRDGFQGLKKHAPFDSIIVTCASPYFPRSLIRQLKKGGLMMIPIKHKNGLQHVYLVYKKSDGSLDFVKKEGVRFVPMKPDLE